METTKYTYNTDIYGAPEGIKSITAPVDMKHVVIVNAEDGSEVIKTYECKGAASRALNYYLRKFDQKNLGASGTWYNLKVEVNA